MKHPARWIALGVGACVVVLGVVLALNVGTDPLAESKSSRLLGEPAPEFDLVDLDGTPVSSESLAGKTVIVNFWNEWCLPCLEELPALQAFWDAHAGDGDVAMVGIVRESNLSKRELVEYVRDEGMDWTIALDPGARAALDFATRAQPETFVISPSGAVAGYQLGATRVRDLEAMLAAGRGDA